MIRIKIGREERELEAADPQWVNQTINRHKREIGDVCVRVRFRKGPLDFSLSTPTCPGNGGGRPPRSEELPILSS